MKVKAWSKESYIWLHGIYKNPVAGEAFESEELKGSLSGQGPVCEESSSDPGWRGGHRQNIENFVGHVQVPRL